MDGEKLRLVIDRLASADAAGKLHWSRGVSSGTYQVAFPNSSIVLEDIRPAKGLAEVNKVVAEQIHGQKFRPGIRLRVLDGSGRDVAVISVAELEEDGDEQRASLVRRLYERAHYEAGGEKLIDDLLTNLAAELK